MAVPTAGALGFALAVTDWGLALRVALCEGTLCSYVDGVLPGAKPDRTPRWVGLFRVEETQEYGGAVYLYTSRSFLNRHGVAYIPPGGNPAPRIGVHHLYGSWYSFVWRF